MPDDSDDKNLNQRIKALEQRVSEQQNTIQKLMPSRRSVLAGAAGLGIGAASMSATSGSAAAQSAAGQIGTDSDRVDVFGATVDTEALEAEKLKTSRTWQDVSGSRALDTVETNSTGSEIDVSVVLQADSDNTNIAVNWLGSSFPSGVSKIDDVYDTGGRPTIQITVPDGADYELNSFGDTEDYQINSWHERRP